MGKDGKNLKGAFVSKADTKTLRYYQNLVAQFPPLRHEEQCRLSSTFSKGRDAAVELMEFKAITDVLGPDWDMDSAMESQSDVAEAVKGLLETPERGEKPSQPKDVSDKIKKDIKRMESDYTSFIENRMFTEKQVRLMKKSVHKGENALETLITHNLQLAMSRVGAVMKKNPMAKKIPVDELIAAANLGLVMGARQFDASTGNKFSTYAAFHIDGQIFQFVESEDGNCGMRSGTTHEMKQKHTLSVVNKHFKARYGRIANDMELQSISGISAEVIKRHKMTPNVRMQSLSAPVKSDGSGTDKTMLLSEVLGSPELVDSDMTEEAAADAIEKLEKSISKLPALHERVVRGLFGIGVDEMETEHKLSRELKITKREVARICEEAQAMLQVDMLDEGVDYSEINFPEDASPLIK